MFTWKLCQALLGLAMIGLVQETHAQRVPSKDCATGVHAIISRGQGAGDDLSVMKALSDKILDQIPGSTTLGFPFDHDPEDKFTAVHSGALMLQGYVADYVKSCPKSKLALVGYSLVDMSPIIMKDCELDCLHIELGRCSYHGSYLRN